MALGCVTGTHRTEWDAYDLVTSDGTKIEVKSSAYLQSWAQRTPSAIRFSIAERTGWDAATNTYAETAARQANVYVFCVFTETDRDLANPLDTRQWRFYVTPTTVLEAVVGPQKTIALSALRARVRPAEVGFDDLDAAVRNAASQKL